MMQLFEATNGWMGESEVRCYVWAETAERALELASAAFAKSRKAYHRDTWVQNISVALLVRGDEPEFCTVPSDCGWEIEQSAIDAAPLTRAEELAHMQALLTSAAAYNNYASQEIIKFAERGVS